MSPNVDEEFYNRADSLINLANEQAPTIGRGKVSASFMFAQARYAAWVSACDFSSGAELRAAKAEITAYFLEQFGLMLDQNIEDYARNFDKYMRPKDKGAKTCSDRE